LELLAFLKAFAAKGDSLLMAGINMNHPNFKCVKDCCWQLGTIGMPNLSNVKYPFIL